MTDSGLDPFSQQSVGRLLEQGTFEETLQALEAVVDRLERGRTSLEEAVNWYEIGLALSQRCSDLLEQAELRVSTLETTYGSTSGDKTLWDADGS